MTVRSMTDRTNSTSNKHKTKSRGASSGLRILLCPDPSLSGRHLHFEPRPGRPSLEDPVTAPICEFWRTIGHTLEKLETTHCGGKTVNSDSQSFVLFLEDHAPEFCGDEAFYR
jgi:hypothetical protein